MDNREREMLEKLSAKTENVKIPESLEPKNIESMLEENKKKRFWNYRYTAGAAAACCLLVCGAVYGINQAGRDRVNSSIAKARTENSKSGNSADERTQASSGGETWKTAENYEDVYEYAQAYMDQMEDAGSYARGEIALYDTGAESTAIMEESASVESKNYSDTNVRQEGVDEADVVKTDGRYLYVLQDGGEAVALVDTKGGEMKEVSAVEAGHDGQIRELYVTDGKMILIQGSVNGSSVKARTYDVSDAKNPKELGEVSQSGNYQSSRVSDGYLYLFSQYYMGTDINVKEADTFVPMVNENILPASSIYLPITDFANIYEVVTSVDLAEPDKICDSKAIFTKGGELYVSNKNIYWYETEWTDNNWYVGDTENNTETVIRRLSYYKGEIAGAASGRVDGSINDSFSIDEYRDYLRLVVTTNDENAVYVLNDSLEMVGAIEGMAQDERVYSARLLGDTGYFVTYKETDPLFTVDFSNPEKPEIIGKLKIPGFSEYLHFFGEDKLLGIGMDVDAETQVTGGVKLSMFDISDPANVEEESVCVLDNVYYTEVFYDYKAALVDEEKNIIGFPAEENGAETYYVFSYDEEKSFDCRMKEQINGSGYQAARGVYIGELLYVVKGNIIEAYQIGDYQKVDDIIL